MTTSRRSFIKKTGLALAGSTLVSSPLFAFFEKNKITGVQLYSVRDDMKQDPKGTLEQLSKMGYRYVEHANYVNRKFYGYDPKDFRKLLDDLGLKMPSGHTVMQLKHWDAAANDFTPEWKYTVEDAATLGQQFVISPWLDESLRQDHDALMHFLDLFNKSGELCKKSGMKFGYHNHDFEFNTQVGDKNLYDVILEHTDPKLVIHQIDIGNMYGVGGRALDIMKKHPGRFASMHVKDEIKSTRNNGEGYESTILGQGVMNVKEILDYAHTKGGTHYFIIEQEAYQGKQPLDTVKTDLAVMKKWGY
ncbi:MAG: sugar phosphate isomerase/epimerase family protein [Flavisolibacter sp.]